MIVRIAAIALAVASFGCATSDVRIEMRWGSDADFARYRSFAWVGALEAQGWFTFISDAAIPEARLTRRQAQCWRVPTRAVRVMRRGRREGLLENGV